MEEQRKAAASVVEYKINPTNLGEWIEARIKEEMARWETHCIINITTYWTDVLPEKTIQTGAVPPADMAARVENVMTEMGLKWEQDTDYEGELVYEVDLLESGLTV